MRHLLNPEVYYVERWQNRYGKGGVFLYEEPLNEYQSQHVNSFGGSIAEYAVLIYAIDARGKGGRIPVEPNYAPGYRNGTMTPRDYCRKIYHYHQPGREGSGL